MKPPEIPKKSHAHADGRKDNIERKEIEEGINEFEIEFVPSPALEAEIRWAQLEVEDASTRH